MNCLKCEHCHISSDVEFDIEIEKPKYSSNITPIGKCSVNMDMCWCDIPEVEGEDFTILSYGKPSKWEKEEWFSYLAAVCENHKEINGQNK